MNALQRLSNTPIEGWKKYAVILALSYPVLHRILAATRLPKLKAKPDVYPSLAALPINSPPRLLYREDLYENGAYVDLPYGRVRYWLIGPETGVKVALIHGLTVPGIVWKKVAEALASKGFRVLVYDLYGRGYSDAPKMSYNTALYTSQLALLMQHIKWDRAHIVGLSMGGGIAAAFSAQFPALCSGKVVLIASAGICRDEDLTKGSGFISSPFMQWIVATRVFRAYMQRKADKKTHKPKVEDIVGMQFTYLPGFFPAFASSIRDGPIRGQHAAFSKLASGDFDVLIIHGTADDTVPYKYANEMHSLMPHNSKIVSIEGGPHFLPVSHPVEVNNALLDFFGAGHDS